MRGFSVRGSDLLRNVNKAAPSHIAPHSSEKRVSGVVYYGCKGG